MAKGHPGDKTILEIGISLIEQKHPNLPSDVKNTIIQTISDYLKQVIGFPQANDIFITLLGQNEVLERLKEILTMSDEPIPFCGEDDESNPASARRKMRTWSSYEDTRLLAGIYKYGIDNWAPISKFIGNGRTRAQCAQRWARGLNPRICKDTWDPNEDMLLIHLVQKFGDRAWTRISSSLGNRSDVQCRYHYHQLAKDMPHLLQMGGAPAQQFPFASFAQPMPLMPIKPFQGSLPPPRFSLPEIPVTFGTHSPTPPVQHVMPPPNMEYVVNRRGSQLPTIPTMIQDPISMKINQIEIEPPKIEQKLGLDDFLTRFK